MGKVVEERGEGGGKHPGEGKREKKQDGEEMTEGWSK